MVVLEGEILMHLDGVEHTVCRRRCRGRAARRPARVQGRRSRRHPAAVPAHARVLPGVLHGRERGGHGRRRSRRATTSTWRACRRRRRRTAASRFSARRRSIGERRRAPARSAPCRRPSNFHRTSSAVSTVISPTAQARSRCTQASSSPRTRDRAHEMDQVEIPDVSSVVGLVPAVFAQLTIDCRPQARRLLVARRCSQHDGDRCHQQPASSNRRAPCSRAAARSAVPYRPTAGSASSIDTRYGSSPRIVMCAEPQPTRWPNAYRRRSPDAAARQIVDDRARAGVRPEDHRATPARTTVERWDLDLMRATEHRGPTFCRQAIERGLRHRTIVARARRRSADDAFANAASRTRHPGALAARDDLDRDLARRLVDHLVAEHHRALAVAFGRGLLVGLEDVERAVELLLARAEHLVEDRDLVGVQRPLAVVAEDLRALAELAEALGARGPSRNGPSITCSPLARPAMRIFTNT